LKWRKLGRIYSPEDTGVEWMASHAAVPFVMYLGEDKYKLFFSTRDRNNRSYTTFATFNIKDPINTSKSSKFQVLSPGEPGAFDDSGAMGSCILDVSESVKFLYYIGWNLGVTVPFRNSIGLAISEDGGITFRKFSNGPIIERNYKEPHFVASCCVLKETVFRIWYLSCTKWEKLGNQMRHYYHIKYAESENGIDWRREGKVAIDFDNKYEYAISVPRVIYDQGLYKMWFSSRGSETSETYRIRYAESKDGIYWKRKYPDQGLDVSEFGWDSEMVCYPHVFSHEGTKYMLYNGNGYGKTGIGLAVLEED